MKKYRVDIFMEDGTTHHTNILALDIFDLAKMIAGMQNTYNFFGIFDDDGRYGRLLNMRFIKRIEYIEIANDEETEDAK